MLFLLLLLLTVISTGSIARSFRTGAAPPQRRLSSHTMSSVAGNNNNVMESVVIHSAPSPWIAIVTEPDACDSDERYEATMTALHQAISSTTTSTTSSSDRNHCCVNLISIRLSRRNHDNHHCNDTTGSIGNTDDIHTTTAGDNKDYDDETQFQSRYIRMIQQLCEWSHYDDDDIDVAYPLDDSPLRLQQTRKFRVVVSSGPYMELGLRHWADGVHVKERHRSQIPKIRQFYRSLYDATCHANHTKWRRSPELLVGTSVHSISSAMEAYSQYQPDYLFVGTCFATQSHPDKVDLEGPRLPSQVCDALHQYITSNVTLESAPRRRPVILGIGGIDEMNCGTVVRPDQSRNRSSSSSTCDGIAVIRSVLQSVDPAQTVTAMYRTMVHSLAQPVIPESNDEYDVTTDV